MAEDVFYTDPNVVKEIAKLTKKDFYYLGLGTEIPAGADLNDYTTPGRYASGTHGSQSYTNAPELAADSFVLTVSIGSMEHIVMQTLELPYFVKNSAYGIYTGATWRRRYNSQTGNWTEWLCTGGIDSIVAEGEKGNTKWVKYANGTCELWALVSSSPYPIQGGWTATGNVFYKTYATYTFPFTINDPIFFVTPFRDAVGDILAIRPYSNTSTSVNLVAYSAYNSSNVYSYAQLHIVGKWK